MCFEHFITIMRTIITGLLVVWIHAALFSQTEYETIRVSANIELIKISENAYMHVSYTVMPQYGRASANGLIFINENKAFLFDTPWTDSLTMDLYYWMRDSMNIPIVGFVPNHWHVDCMGGLGFLQTQKVESYANQMTIDIARSKNLPVPDHGFNDSLLLHLGDKVIHCYYPGPAHSLDNIVIWIPSEQILFAGCMVKCLSSDNLGNTADGDLKAYPETLNRMLEKYPESRIVIPGHGSFGGLDLIEHTIKLATH